MISNANMPQNVTRIEKIHIHAQESWKNTIVGFIDSSHKALLKCTLMTDLTIYFYDQKSRVLKQANENMKSRDFDPAQFQ